MITLKPSMRSLWIATRRAFIVLALTTILPLLIAQESSPGARSGARMVYDSAHKQLLMFGGTSAGEYPSGLWCWDGTAWRNLVPSGAEEPLGRDEPSLEYDAARRRVVMFGGRREVRGKPVDLLGDVWEWDGKNWQRNPNASLPVLHAATVYDRVRRSVIMFGGIEDAGISRKLWQWNGLAWRLLDSAGPSSLATAAIASGGALSFITLQSGRSDDRVDTLTWKWAGGVWSTAETGPPITSLQPSATAPDGTVFIYQAQDWLSAPVLHIRSTAGLWRRITLPTQPASRTSAACGYDAARKRLVLYGGSANRGQILFADTWEFDGKQWTRK